MKSSHRSKTMSARKREKERKSGEREGEDMDEGRNYLLKILEVLRGIITTLAFLIQ